MSGIACVCVCVFACEVTTGTLWSLSQPKGESRRHGNRDQQQYSPLFNPETAKQMLASVFFHLSQER